MADPKKAMASFRLSEQTREKLEVLADVYESQANVIEHAADLLTDPKISSIIGGGQFAAQQGLRLLCDLLTPSCQKVEDKFSRPEWNLIADANNGCSPMFSMMGIDPRHAPTMLIANVEDDIRLNCGDQKWLAEDNPREAAKRGKALVAKLAALDELERWAVLLAVQFFWEDARPSDKGGQRIDHQRDEWWRLSFRRKAATKEKGRAKAE